MTEAKVFGVKKLLSRLSKRFVGLVFLNGISQELAKAHPQGLSGLIQDTLIAQNPTLADAKILSVIYRQDFRDLLQRQAGITYLQTQASKNADASSVVILMALALNHNPNTQELPMGLDQYVRLLEKGVYIVLPVPMRLVEEGLSFVILGSRTYKIAA